MAAMLPRRQAKDAIPIDTATEDDLELVKHDLFFTGKVRYRVGGQFKG